MLHILFILDMGDMTWDDITRVFMYHSIFASVMSSEFWVLFCLMLSNAGCELWTLWGMEGCEQLARVSRAYTMDFVMDALYIDNFTAPRNPRVENH